MSYPRTSFENSVNMKPYLLLILLFICSCLPGGDEYKPLDIELTLNFNSALTNPPKRSFIYDIVDSVQIIALETNDESVLNDFVNFEFGPEFIYILDFSHAGSVAIFRHDGSFVKRIPVGQGPGEIYNAIDITFDFAKNELLVFQLGGVNRYTADGLFKDHYDVQYFIEDMMPKPNGDGYVVVQAEGANRYRLFTVFWVDSCFSIQRSVNLPLRTYLNHNPHLLTHSVDGFVNLSRFIDSDVYAIGDSTIRIKRQLDFSDCALELPEVDDISDYNQYKSLESDTKFLYTAGFCETNNYEFYTFKSKSDYLVFYRNKNTGEIIGPIEISSKHSLLEAPSVYAHSYGDFFISIEYHTDDLMHYEANSKVFSPAQMEILRNSKPDDNPLIILYRLKDIPVDTE